MSSSSSCMRYVLKAIYSSAASPRGMDRHLLQMLAYRCYSGGSILCGWHYIAPGKPQQNGFMEASTPGWGMNS